MDSYYVNKNEQSNGDHEVHTGSCQYLPTVDNRIYLGYYSSCQEAINKAKEHYSKVDGCYFCSKPCHKG